jgi:hypothetical protein
VPVAPSHPVVDFVTALLPREASYRGSQISVIRGLLQPFKLCCGTAEIVSGFDVQEKLYTLFLFILFNIVFFSSPPCLISLQETQTPLSIRDRG